MRSLLARARQNGETHPWMIAFTVMLAIFMEVLDTSVANVALPHIAGNLSAGVDESTWVLTSYLVSNAIVLPLTGWFSSIFGRKRFYMTCVAIFTLSSLLCGLAPSLPLLVFFRILQGAGGGALQPISQAILLESFPEGEAGHGHGHLRDGRGAGAHHRPHAGRLDHRQLQLALDFPYQYSGGRDLAGAYLLSSLTRRTLCGRACARGQDRLHRHRPAECGAGISSGGSG